jgi:hypothetical protein
MSRSTSHDASATAPTTTWARKNWLLITLFTALSIVGVVVSTGALGFGLVDADGGSSDGVSVPAYVYLYASMGALGYIFTKLMSGIESYDETDDMDRLVELALRIPVAWVLGAGVYLLSTALLAPGQPETARFTAGVAFLVGLYVNVTMKSLGSLADRLLGRGSDR